MNKNNPLVSIIMNCFNGEKYLKESLTSIINQSYTNWELIFWDNKSTDQSSQIIKKTIDNRINYYYSDNFEKLYKARNLALEKASGDFICFLDTDDFYDKDFIKKHLDKILKSDCDIVYSKYFIKNEINHTIYTNNKKNLPSGLITQNLLRDNLVGISAVFLKRKVFDVLKFNQNYEVIGDFDFFFRLSLITKFSTLQEPLLTYRHHKNNFTNKFNNIFINELKFWIKDNEKLLKNKYSTKFLRLKILKLQIKNIFKIF
tara:strand:- start:584 stop:1360 length:777 start_codon:yes stop_codon:yes gene_type:complete